MFDSNPNDFFWAMHKAWHQKESTKKVKINKYKSTTLLCTPASEVAQRYLKNK